MKLSRAVVLFACLSILTVGGWTQETLPGQPPVPGTGGAAVIVIPEHPTPGQLVGLDIVGQTNNLGDWPQLRSATLIDHLVVVQLSLRWSPAMGAVDSPMARPWKLHVDLGVLDAGLYHVMLFLNGLPAVQREFVVGEPGPEPLLLYSESGGFIGLNNHLVVMPGGEFEVHWLVMNASTAAGIGNGVINPDCTGHLTDEQMHALAAIFEKYDFAHWDPVYGQVPGPTDPAILIPIVADGRIWHIQWKGKLVQVFEGGPIPEKVWGLIQELDAFAMELAKSCLPPPPPPVELRGEIKSIVPEHPSATDVLTIRVGGAFPDPSYHVDGKQVVVQEHEVRIKVHVVHDASGPVITVIQPWEETVHAGPLAAGAWTVTLEINGHVVDQRPLYVRPADGSNTNEVIIRVFPEIPNASSPTALEVLGVFHEPRVIAEHSWAQENHTIRVTIKSATADANTLPGVTTVPSTGVVIPWRVREELGMLAAGEYHVVVNLDGHNVAGKIFVVQPAPTPNPGALNSVERGGSVDVDSNGRVDYADLLRLMRYWHVE